MITTEKKSRRSSKHEYWTDNLGIGLQHRQARTKLKSPSLCDEEGCRHPITHWLKFKSERMGFYCNEHKERFEKWGILARIESAYREGV